MSQTATSSHAGAARPNFRLFGLWRFSAALLITVYHFGYNKVEHAALTSFVLEMFTLLDMFFVMSGFLIMAHYSTMPLSASGYYTFIVKRFSRIYPLHLLTLSFFVLIAILASLGIFSSAGAHERYAFSSLIPNLLLIQAWGMEETLTFNYVSWSASGEWFAYLLFPISLLVARRYGLTALIGLFLITFTLLELASALSLFRGKMWYDTNQFAAYRVYADFLIGMILCQIVMTSRLRLSSQWPGIVAMIFALTMMHYSDNFYLQIVLLSLAIFLCALAEKNNPDCTRWLAPFAPVTAVSFGIYLWHPVLETVMFAGIWRRVLDSPEPYFWPFAALSAAITVVVAMVSARRLENPMGNLIKRILLRDAPRANEQAKSSQNTALKQA